MRAMSWRPWAFLRNGTSLTLRPNFAAGSWAVLPFGAFARPGRAAAAPRALTVCRKLRRCMRTSFSMALYPAAYRYGESLARGDNRSDHGQDPMARGARRA